MTAGDAKISAVLGGTGVECGATRVGRVSPTRVAPLPNRVAAACEPANIQVAAKPKGEQQ